MGAPADATSQGGADQGKTVQYWLDNQDQFAEMSKLPPHWIRIKSSGGTRIYFLNIVSGKSQLFEPDELPPGWTKQVSRSTGKQYYWHGETGKTQFEKPGF